MPVVGTLYGRSSDLQAAYLLQLPSSWLNQCFNWSVRSCLPLRGSSGFSPDSLLSPTTEVEHRKVVLNIEQILCTGQRGLISHLFISVRQRVISGRLVGDAAREQNFHSSLSCS
jgi:hypothetical protein